MRTKATRRAVTRTAAVVLCLALVVGCSDDGDDEATSTTTTTVATTTTEPLPAGTEQFCTALQVVKQRGIDVSTIKLDTDEDVPEAKSKLLGLIDALQASMLLAPPELLDSASQINALVTQIKPLVQDAVTANDLRIQVPALAEVVATKLRTENEIGDPLVAFVVRYCPDV